MKDAFLEKIIFLNISRHIEYNISFVVENDFTMTFYFFTSIEPCEERHINIDLLFIYNNIITLR